MPDITLRPIIESYTAMTRDKLTLAGLHNTGIQTHVKGRAAASDAEKGVRLELYRSSEADGYANAQIDDYRIDRRNRFRWRANVQLRLRARFSCTANEMTGTAGFGFWNAPVGIGIRSIPSAPAAAWFFFAGPNSDIAAAKGVPGSGWKASSIDTRNRFFALLLPTAPVAIPLMRIKAAYNRLWPVAQRAMRVNEKILASSIDEWHEYAITWTGDSLRYEIDGDIVQVCNDPPQGSMGFVAWIDNQYMVATPQGRFRQGIVPVVSARSLEISSLSMCEISRNSK